MAIAKNKVFYWVISRKMLISGGDEHFWGEGLRGWENKIA